MTRVSENSSKHAVNYATQKVKTKLEDLTLKGSSFKTMLKPSDNPIGNTEVLALRSVKSDNEQYIKNGSLAKSQLEYAESALSDLGDVVARAKELAIQQASSLYGSDIRKQIAEEINQLHDQSLAIANRRFGNRYIFSGHKTLTKAVNKDGTYLGDDGKMTVEVSKDFFVPMNVNGLEVFFGKDKANEKIFDPQLYDQKQIQEDPEVDISKHPNRSLASYDENEEQQGQSELRPYEQRVPEDERNYPGGGRSNLFNDLKSLRNAMQTDNHEIIQDLLEKLDSYTSHITKMRTKIGATINSIDSSTNQNERDIITHETYRTEIEDIDVAELASELQKQQATLNATYKVSGQLLNNNLIDFLR